MKIYFCIQCNTLAYITKYNPKYHGDPYKCRLCSIKWLNKRRLERWKNGDFDDPGPCPDVKTMTVEEGADWLHRKVDHRVARYIEEHPEQFKVPVLAPNTKTEEIRDGILTQIQLMNIENLLV